MTRDREEWWTGLVIDFEIFRMMKGVFQIKREGFFPRSDRGASFSLARRKRRRVKILSRLITLFSV